MSDNFINRLMWGVLIIVVGVGLMLRQAGYVHFNITRLIVVYWPVVLMFAGVQRLLQRMAYGRGSIFAPGVMIVIGGLFLGRNLSWWSIGGMVKIAGPLVLIIFGLSIIFKPKSRSVSNELQNEWKAYNYRTTDAPVPPAPPLHPDPTRTHTADDTDPTGGTQETSGEWDDGVKDHGIPPFGKQAPPFGDRRWEHGGNWEKYAPRAGRILEHIERAHSRHQHQHRPHGRGREEWWNNDPNVQTRSGFIGDIYLGHDYWELKPMNISHFIGDTVLDLTKAQIMPGETAIHISSFVGDVKIYLPNDSDIGVHVLSSAFVGDVSVLEQREGGILKNMNVETPFFQDTDKKITLHISTFIGDVRVTKVG